MSQGGPAKRRPLVSIPPLAWGKTDASGGWHDLRAHCLDVAAVFEAMATLPVPRLRLETAAGRSLDGRDLARLAVLVALHDAGKVHPWFQAKAWADPGPFANARISHSESGKGLVEWAFHDRGHPLHGLVEIMVGWGEEAVANLLASIFAHHGRPVGGFPAGDASWPRHPRYDWRRSVHELDAAIRHAFSPAFEQGGRPLPDRSPFVHHVAGLTALADWVGSDADFFFFEPSPGTGYAEVARTAARAALDAFGLDPRGLASPVTSFLALTGWDPNPAQDAILATDPAEPLVILEAETGSGKTEAALAYFARAFAAGEVEGLYFAVPTRAAATQLHTRVDQVLGRMFPGSGLEAVLAIPGQTRAGRAKGRRLPDFSVLWDDAAPRPSRWAAEHATRFLAATVAVGTVDQALLAALQVKHAPLRAAALARSLLVIDEVHASDAYMTRVASELLDGHLALGGRAMLMSATLGAAARARYLKALVPAIEEATTAPYPAVWTRRGVQQADGTGRTKAVKVDAHMGWEPEAAATLAVAAAERGARVLVIRNTVAAALATFRAARSLGADALLLQASGGPALHHARFAPEDRSLLDAAVEAALAPDKGRTPGGQVVIGTQTLEQSLDIDADLLVTDLCPIDVLLQRVGRLHRHELPRPTGFERPRATVLCPADGLD